MSERKWIQGANGLWTSYDKVIRRATLRDVAKARIAAIRCRFDEVMNRNGFVKRGNCWKKVV